MIAARWEGRLINPFSPSRVMNWHDRYRRSSGRARSKRVPGTYVTGFGCRPGSELSTRTEGRRSKAAGERSRGRLGARLSRRYGDLVFSACAVGAIDVCWRRRLLAG